ncbi:hypothetical protein [Actinosynnema sp. NPDC020468]|uniref:hypothetical protein n=1 Tax=Actinosynnema sp. NPDC020468 TaxID=3154488 RepID=UPI0033C1AF11
MTAAMIPELPPDTLKALWVELHAPRAAVHRQHRVRACDTELHGRGLRLGARTSRATAGAHTAYLLIGQCPCRDLVADAVEVALAFLTDRGGSLTNPPGAVRHHLRFRLVDLHRRARGDLGAQVKPETVAGNRYGRALPDEFHRALYVMLADEAGVRGPIRGQEGLLRRLADRGAARSEDQRRRLPAALRLIERTCRTGPRVNVGTRTHPELVSWWEAYIDRPLGRRADPADHPLLGVPDGPDRVREIRDPAAELAFDLVLRSAADRGGRADESEEDAVVRALRDSVCPVAEHAADAALRDVITRLGEQELLPAERVRVLLADPDHRREIVARVRALAPSDTRDER